MPNTHLNDLIEALAGAAIEAQDGKGRKALQTVPMDIEGGGGGKSLSLAVP
jgi:hypothetical protein